MSQKDYPELEGKEIIVKGFEANHPGIVTGCNYDIGITIEHRDQKGFYLSCLNGPSSRQWKEASNNDKTKSIYPALFYNRVVAIKKGIYNFAKTDLLHKLVNIQAGVTSADSCSFI